MNLSLILELAKRDLTEHYSGSSLGAIWNFIYPLVNIFIYMVIFSKIMSARLPSSSSTYGYGIYLVSGVVPWTAFSNTLMRTSTVFLEKKHIITKIKVDLNTFPLYIVLSESIIFAMTFSIFIGFLFISGQPISPLIVLVPLVYLIQQFFAYSLGFLIAMFVVFLRDLKEIVVIGLQMWFWFTPIVYVYDILPDIVKKLMIFNPAFLFIQGYQSIFVYNQMPNFNYLLYLLVSSIMILLGANLIFKKLEKDIRDFI
jgi:lipopolysaccharide transport system permease protein